MPTSPVPHTCVYMSYVRHLGCSARKSKNHNWLEYLNTSSSRSKRSGIISPHTYLSASAIWSINAWPMENAHLCLTIWFCDRNINSIIHSNSLSKLYEESHNLKYFKLWSCWLPARWLIICYSGSNVLNILRIVNHCMDQCVTVYVLCAVDAEGYWSVSVNILEVCVCVCLCVQWMRRWVWISKC